MWTLLIYRREREDPGNPDDWSIWEHVVSLEEYKNQVCRMDGVEVHHIVWAYVPIAIPPSSIQTDTNNNANNNNDNNKKTNNKKTNNNNSRAEGTTLSAEDAAWLSNQEYLFVVNLSTVQFVSVCVSAKEDLVPSAPMLTKQCYAENVLTNEKRSNCTLQFTQFARTRGSWSRANVSMVVNVLDARRNEKILDMPFLSASHAVCVAKQRQKEAGLKCCPFCMFAQMGDGGRNGDDADYWYNTEKRLPRGEVQNNPLERYHIDTTTFRHHGWLCQENLDAHIALRHSNSNYQID